MVAFGFLTQNFGRWQGPTNDTLSFYECRFSEGNTMRWWGHSNPRQWGYKNFGAITRTHLLFLLPPATKLGQGYVFTGVCYSVHRGQYLTRYTPQDQVPPPDQVHPLPQIRYTPWTRYTPQDQVHPPWTRFTPQDQVHPQDQLHPLDQVPPLWTRYTPWLRACWKIRSTRGRYASYWNAILLFGYF